jgi:hypothetical protein
MELCRSSACVSELVLALVNNVGVLTVKPLDSDVRYKMRTKGATGCAYEGYVADVFERHDGEFTVSCFSKI